MTDKNTKARMDFAAKLNKLVLKDLNKTSTDRSSLLRKYKKEDVARFLENPEKNEKQLRQVSNYLYNASPNYKRLIQYFTGMLQFKYIIKPLGVDRSKVNLRSFSIQYNKIANVLENMSISHEFSKAIKYALKEDVFYGYEHENEDSYFIQRINPDLCKIKTIEDGVYNFAFDFSYFDIHEEKLDFYPAEFKQKYKQYQGTKTKWIELNSEKTIVLKINEEIEYPIPPFNTVFEAIFDIEEYKQYQKIKTRMDNYMLLTHQIPIDEKSNEVDSFLIDLDTAIDFHNRISQELPDEVGLVTSPMPIEAIRLDSKNKDTDTVAEAERAYYNDAGVSQFLFNAEKTSSVGLNKSINTDESMMFLLLRQIQRWVNRKIKRLCTTYQFRCEFLELTIFNEDEKAEKYLKASQFGMPTKQHYAATIGLSPSTFDGMEFLENDVLKLHEKLKPLVSSHTQSGSDEGGRTQKSDDELGESGIKTRDEEGNVRE